MSAAAEQLEVLAEKADQAYDVLRLATIPPLLSVVRGLMNECGIGKRTSELDAAVAALRDAPSLVANAQAHLLEMQDREKRCREAYDTALAEAEWALDARFVQDGNKTFLVTWHRENEATPDEAAARGWKLVEGTKSSSGAETKTYEERRQMTADERRAWVRRNAAQAREVTPLAGDLERASHAVAMARVDVASAEDRWQAVRYAVDACRTQLAASATQLEALAHATRGHATDSNGSNGEGR